MDEDRFYARLADEYEDPSMTHDDREEALTQAYEDQWEDEY